MTNTLAELENATMPIDPDQGLVLTIDRHDYIKENNNASWIPKNWRGDDEMETLLIDFWIH